MTTFAVSARVTLTLEVPESDDDYEAVYVALSEELPLGVEIEDFGYTEIP